MRFRASVDDRLEELRHAEPDPDVPAMLDYCKWFDYRLSLSSSGRGDTEVTRELRALGSGGEQGVPNYLLVLALAKLLFDNASALVRPPLHLAPYHSWNDSGVTQKSLFPERAEQPLAEDAVRVVR